MIKQKSKAPVLN